MANIVYIEDAFFSEKLVTGEVPYSRSFLLSEDIQLQINTEMSSFAEDVGQLADLISTLTNISSLGGSISQGALDTQNLFDTPRWRKTDPVKITMELVCFTEGGAKNDVYDRVMGLVNYSIPWKTGFLKDRLTIPGINLNTIGNYQIRPKTAVKLSAKQTNLMKNHSSLIALYIPGIIFLKTALVKSAQPTFSKEITSSGYPLWGKLSLEVWGITPATSEIFDEIEFKTQSDLSYRV